MTILRKRIIFQHKDYPRGKTLPNLYAKRQFRVLVSLIYQNTRGGCGSPAKKTQHKIACKQLGVNTIYCGFDMFLHI